jgi:hypothetical protein
VRFGRFGVVGSCKVYWVGVCSGMAGLVRKAMVNCLFIFRRFT